MNLTFLALLNLVTTYGPSVVTLIQKLRASVAAGKGNEVVTDADWAELSRLASQTGEDIYERLGIDPPPAAPTSP